MVTIEKTYSVVVAIESYSDLGDGWKLQGACAQAVEFIKWLLNDRKVPPTNIQVFQCGLDIQELTNLNIAANQYADASAQSINNFFANIGKHWPDGELLFIYWIGHGFVSHDGGRRLILSDAKPLLMNNLDVNQLISLLRSDQAGKFCQQIAIIDTCARFFEELQRSTSLPEGGLNQGTQRIGITQNFYFAASSGEYAKNNIFGPEMVKLLKILPADIWPPETLALRNSIEAIFAKLATERLAEQQPAWFEYCDGLNNKFTRGVLPTFDDIHKICKRVNFPIYRLRQLTEKASACIKLSSRIVRDELYKFIEFQSLYPLYRPEEVRDDLQLDLMRLIAGAIEQDKIVILADKIISMESNSDEALLFKQATGSVNILRRIWPSLVAIRLPLTRCLQLFKDTCSYCFLNVSSNNESGSIDEIIGELLEFENYQKPLIDFLIRVAKEYPENPHCCNLQSQLEQSAELTALCEEANNYLSKEKKSAAPIYLLAQIGELGNACRVTRSWLWPGSSRAPSELEELDMQGNLGSDIDILLNEAENNAEGRKVYLEILVPEELLHLEHGQLTCNNDGSKLDPEYLHPIVLRLLNRMMATPRDRIYRKGYWKSANTAIRERLKIQRRAYWFNHNDSLNTICKKFYVDQCGELIGIPLASDGESRKALFDIIRSGGIPYAFWPRSSNVKLGEDAKNKIQELIDKNTFDDIPKALLSSRSNNETPSLLAEILLLWDDPTRNPFDLKLSETSQRG